MLTPMSSSCLHLFSFLTQFKIFLILGMMSDFLRKPWHFHINLCNFCFSWLSLVLLWKGSRKLLPYFFQVGIRCPDCWTDSWERTLLGVHAFQAVSTGSTGIEVTSPGRIIGELPYRLIMVKVLILIQSLLVWVGLGCSFLFVFLW